MAMTIRNDSGSMMALGQMKKNDSSLDKQLKKVASGMRINSAGDDSSAYSISERMRVLIRSLGQDIQNTKNGKDLVSVAEGGIQEIVNNLRSMKEMAINSANDHNTDLDRQTLEKEFASRKQTITDIAATTNYNGRLLLTGEWKKYRAGGPTSAGASQGTQATLVSGFQVAFNSCAYRAGGRSGGGVPVDNTFYAGSSAPWNYWTATGQTRPTGSVQNKQIAVSLDFSGLNVNYPTDLDGKGFSILCGACSQYIDIKFDASTTTTTYTRTPTPAPGQPSNSLARAYTIGIQNVTNAADLSQAIFNGISSVQSQVAGGSTVDITAQNVLIDNKHHLRMAEISGSYYYLKDNDGCPLQFIDGVFGGQPNNFSGGTPAVLGNPLIIHTGPKANQELRIFINGMYPQDMGIEDSHVTPQEAALLALGEIDDALDYCLNEITTMGSYQMRLSQTEESLVTNEENSQSAESTLRDADMAKEMTDYTKANILSQSAQAMLAQANQNNSSVLSLLQ